ncbi:hypothetical protein [Mesorhizobium sp. M1050]
MARLKDAEKLAIKLKTNSVGLKSINVADEAIEVVAGLTAESAL